MSHDKAATIIVDGKGSHFDPDIVDAFLAIQDEFQAIAARFVDTEKDLQIKAASLSVLQGSGQAPA